jgi:hypothetical protein
MRLDKLAKASAFHQSQQDNHSILIYGAGKTGKTKFVATAAELDEIQNIYWFDLENGYQTILHSGLPEEALAKIQLYRIRDTRSNPIGIETILKSIASGKAVSICEAHGKVGCVECKKAGLDFSDFNLAACGHNDLVVIDSGSQLGDSALAAACLGKDISFKPGFDEYGLAGFWLSDVLSVVQQCQHTNFVIITHELIDTDEINGKQTDRIYPLLGTRAFCRKVSKYFGTVAYFHMKMGKHAAGSSTTYKSEVSTGSRINAKLEASKDISMRDILISGGILSSVGASSQNEASRQNEASASSSPSPAKKETPAVILSGNTRLANLLRKPV